MKIAILGATSQIGKDLVCSFAAQSTHELVLYARRPKVVTQWLAIANFPGRYAVNDFDAFNTDAHFDAILNFVGVGNPAQAVAMCASIIDVTLQYDELALNYVRQRPECRYIFLSSGAAYGSRFDSPVDASTKAAVEINNLQPHDWYGVAKLYAECRHRSLAHLPIVDLRVFNYFSHTQDMDARFFITDMVRAIRDKTVLMTSPDNIVRDYLHPSDFYRLIKALLSAPPMNLAVDCYSRAPIDKLCLLSIMENEFGLQHSLAITPSGINATGSKRNYYSLNTRAAEVGYRPEYTSLEGVLLESRRVIDLSTQN